MVRKSARSSSTAQAQVPVTEAQSEKVKDSSVTNINNIGNCQALEQSVPIYQGQNSGDPALWLQKYKRYTLLKQWNNTVKCLSFSLFLDNAAAQWFNQLSDSVTNNFEVLTETFISEFSLSKTQQLSKLSKLINRKQQSNESVESYILDVSAKCRELTRSPQQELEYIVQGLLPSIQQQVLLKEPSTLSDVKRVALLVESVTPTVSVAGESTVFTTANSTPVNSVSDDLVCIKQQLKTQADQVAELTLQLKRKATDVQDHSKRSQHGGLYEARHDNRRRDTHYQQPAPYNCG
jgi:hypothetical protein